MGKTQAQIFLHRQTCSKYNHIILIRLKFITYMLHLLLYIIPLSNPYILFYISISYNTNHSILDTCLNENF